MPHVLSPFQDAATGGLGRSGPKHELELLRQLEDHGIDGLGEVGGVTSRTTHGCFLLQHKRVASGLQHLHPLEYRVSVRTHAQRPLVPLMQFLGKSESEGPLRHWNVMRLTAE